MTGAQHTNRKLCAIFAGAAIIRAVMGGDDALAATIVVRPGGLIQSGIDSAASGDTVLVEAGSYTGGISLNRAITLQAEPGVTVNGNKGDRAVLIQCSDCSVIGFTFVDFEYGISPDGITGRNRVMLRNNIQRRTNYGFWISGDDWTVEENEVDGIVRRSPGGDADYGRIFGNRHVVARNWFHGTRIPADLGPGPDYAHTDCLQYYNQNGEILRDILIEENVFTDFVQGLFIGNETGDESAVQRVTVRSNVFWGTDFPAADNLLGTPSWGIYFGKNGPVRQLVVENNIFYNCSNAIGILTGTDAIVRRNIVAYSGSVYLLEGTLPSSITTTPGGNLLFGNDWVGEMLPPGDATNVNPQFQNTSRLVGNDGVPWTLDDGWRPMNPAASAFGPQATPDGNDVVGDDGGGSDGGGSDGGGGGGGGCFIATAAYGTPMAMEIETLRDVRDAYLINTAIGAAFVDTYYRVSPPIARMVSEYPVLRKGIRAVLAPMVSKSRSPWCVSGMALAIVTFTSVAALRVNRRMQSGTGKQAG